MTGQLMRGPAIAVALYMTWASAEPAEWWNDDWHYRVPVTVASGLYDRTDCLASVPLALAAMAKQAGIAKGIDADSLRIVEVTDGRAREIPSAYRKHNRGGRSGTLIWQLSGKTPSLSERCYQVYFDSLGSGRQPPRYPPIPGAEVVSGENIVPNSSFEEVAEDGQPVGWRRIGVTKDTIGSARASREHVRTGVHSLCITKPDDEGKSYMYSCHGWRTPIPAKPNAKYRLRAWTRATGKSQHCIGFYFLAGGWQSTQRRVYKILCGQGGHDWQQLAAYLTAPVDAKYIHIRLYIFEGSGDVFFDDIEVQEIPRQPPPKVVVGAVEKRR